jgi:hypothetical protein
MHKPLALIALWVSIPAYAAYPSQLAKVESIEGAKTALLQSGIKLRDVSVGERVRVGERIRTDAKTKVTLSYPDGSLLVIYPNSDLEIEKPKDGVQSNQLRGGDVQGSIEKVPPPKDGSQTKVKFIIRTKTAVMGVRGTEFVVGYNAVSGLSSFHTLTGTVEVASSPAQLLGGSGVAVSGGQFVSATETGISAIQPFNTSTFLAALESSAGSAAASAAAGAAMDGVGNAAVSGVTSVLPDARSSTSASPPAPPPKLPPPPAPAPLPPAVAEKNAADAEKERPRMHLVSFSVAAFMSENPVAEGEFLPSGLPATRYTAIQFHWTPSVPLPVLDFLYVRGSFGATVFEHGSLNNGFLIHDYQLLAGTSLLNPLYAEVGGGHQSWRTEDIKGGVLSGNVGLILSTNGRLNRLFVGGSKFLRGTQPFEIRAGIGIQFF